MLIRRPAPESVVSPMNPGLLLRFSSPNVRNEEDFSRLASLLGLCVHTLRLLVTQASLDGASDAACQLSDEIDDVAEKVRALGAKAKALEDQRTS